MILTVSPLDLILARPFGISRWTRTSAANVFVRVEADGVVGYGEGAPNARYGESQAEAIAYIHRINLPPVDSDDALRSVLETEHRRDGGHWSAKAALDMALHDWWAKAQQLPVYALWGGRRPDPKVTSFTIGIDRPEVMAEKAGEAGAFDVLKIKVGTEADEANLRAIRGVTDRPLRVDANEGWTSRERALERLQWLAEEGVELVEQPLPAGRLADMEWLRDRSPIPLYADEDCGRSGDVSRLAEAFDGINIKLDKCGGLLEAGRMIDLARKHDLRVMLGCMASSSLSTTAAFHLSSKADVLDLDGHLLLANDPFEGVELVSGRLRLPDRIGLGVRPRADT